MSERRRAYDRRCIRTKRAIRRALLQAMQDRDLEELTITEIAGAANINRKTFYSHYAGLIDVLEEIEDGFARWLIALLDPVSPGDNLCPVLEEITASIVKNRPFYVTLMKTRRAVVMRKVKQAVGLWIAQRQVMARAGNEARLLLYESIAAGMAALYQDWLECDSPVPIGQVAALAGGLLQAGLALPVSA